MVLLQTDVKEESKLADLLNETWNSAVLDSGATKTVAGKVWLDNYVSTLPEMDRCKVKVSDCDRPYVFGDGIAVVAK